MDRHATLIKPQALQPGDTIGVVTPSWCGPAMFPHRVQRGAQFLESLGYRVVLSPHAFGHKGYVSGTAEQRASDIHQLFADPGVRAIFSAIGGDHSNHLLPFLDWDLIRRHPKIFLGWSDTTVLAWAMYSQANLVTFMGPAVMTGLAEFPAPLPYTVRSLQRLLSVPKPYGPIDPATQWTEEHLDWRDKLDLTRPRRLQTSPGWTWLKGGRAEGRLVGGCLESIQHLRGTPYWPDLTDAILFFETSEEVPSPEWVDAVLQDFENMDVLRRLRGLLVGRPYGYTERQKAELHQVILERTARYDFPIVTDLDFGHTDPTLTIPIGCRATIDVGKQQIRMVEAAVTGAG